MGKSKAGIYPKFDVARMHDPEDKHSDCEYFVLDWDHDPFAIPAMKAYAAACAATYPELAKDILHYIRVYGPKETHHGS